ncbi:MAG TPA: cation-translocating P-type ATPase C-terminal domain-containing protein, partial [Thermoanaerobaculia bacterium]|nr:cation-translocating P-type ATPase C-terminal domain-containing protein [Thermoanaerobaculia bacterium]
WLNLVVHIFPAVALALVPGERDVMARPPRDPKEPLLTWGATGRTALRSAVVAAVALWSYTAGGGRSGGPRGQTLVMATLALTLLAQSFATLSDTQPFWRMRSSLAPAFWLALAGGLLLQAVAVVWPPLASVLLTEPLSATDWLRVLGMSLVALAAVEAGKAFAARE